MRAKFVVLLGLLLMLPLVVSLGGVQTAAAGPKPKAKPKLTLAVASAPIAQTAGGSHGRTLFSGRVTPARRGAKVLLERRNAAGKWVVVARAVQSRTGTYQGLYVARSPEFLRIRSLPAGRKSLVASPVRKSAAYRLKFNENFNGSHLDGSRWQTREQPMHGSRPCSKPAADRVSVGGGVATLSVRKRLLWCAASEKYKNMGTYDNAMIGTKEPYRYTHGVFAARVKFQSAQGMHGGFWLQSTQGSKGAEIDIAEYFGADSPEKLTVLVHHTDASGTRTAGKRGKELPTQKILGKRQTPSNGYHVYAVDWDKNRYRFFLDGKLMMTTSKPYVSQAPEEIVLSLLTSDWEIYRLKTTNSTMQVDWVRVWQR